MANKWCDDWPENIGLKILLKKATYRATGLVFLFGKREWPRINVGVFFDNVGVGVMLDVVLFPPIIH